ncbi:MAG: DUF4089 domain-containing protein [Betaproteobacteria bacterium]|nr:DUF4089 domain-containing protein [Betaproteobacteria bacterium]
MKPAEIPPYVDAALALHGYQLSEAARAEVLRQFTLGATIAAGFLDLPLGPEDEMAPVFTPVSPA